MPEISINVGDIQPLTVRLESTEVRASGTAAWPRLDLPFQIQLLPSRSEGHEFNYVLLWLSGRLHSPAIGDFAVFDAGPLVEESHATRSYRQVDVRVEMHHAQIRQLEDARSGRDAELHVYFSGLAWLPAEEKFRTVQSNSPLQVKVPSSHWVEQVVARWGLDKVKVIEIRFPRSEAGDNFLAAYSRVEAAEKHFASGQYEEVLAELFSGFEGLAKSQGCARPDQQFFVKVLGDLHPEKKGKAKLILDHLCGFLQLGRHAPGESPENFSVSRRDARFALTMAYAVFEYIVPQG